MSIPTQNLVFDINPLLGHFNDQSSNGNDAAQNANSFVKATQGWGSNPENGTLSIADDATLDVSSTGFTYMVYLDITKDQVGGDRILYKAGAYDFYFANSTTLGYSDGSLAYTIAGTSGYKNVQTICITKEAISSKAQVYFDGVYVAQASGNNAIGSSSNTLYIGNAVGVANKMDCKIMSAVMYAEAMDAAAVADLHKALITRKTPFKQKRNFYTAPSVRAVASGMAENAVVVNGKTIDQGPNRYDGTIYSDIAATQPAGMDAGLTPWGEPCLLNQKGTGAHLNYGAAANNHFATADSVFGYARWFKCSSNGSQMLMSRSSNYFFQKVSSGQLQLSIGSGAWVTTTSPIRDDVWHLASFFLDADFEYIYVDGEFIKKQARTGLPSSVTLREGQYVITGFDIDGGIGPRVFYKEFTDLAEYEAELKTEWNRVANKVIYRQDFSDAYEHVSTYGPGPLPGTDLNVSLVSSKVVPGVNAGEKSLTGGGAGSTLSTPGVDHTFGKFVIEYESVAGSRCRFNHIDGVSFVVHDFGQATSTIAVSLSTGGGLTGPVGGLTNGNHTAVIEKKANLSTLNTTLYNDGELVTAATGSNPYTDTTLFTKEMQLAPYGSTKIHSITQYFGVPIE